MPRLSDLGVAWEPVAVEMLEPTTEPPTYRVTCEVRQDDGTLGLATVERRWSSEQRQRFAAVFGR